MEYQFETVDVPSEPCLFIAATCPQDRIGPTLTRLYPELYSHIHNNDLPGGGPPFCRYRDWRESDCDLEAGARLQTAATGNDRVQPGLYGGCACVKTVHTGPYDKLPEAYNAGFAWMHEHGHELKGAPWELYIDDPQSTPSDRLRTEVYLPVG